MASNDDYKLIMYQNIHNVLKFQKGIKDIVNSFLDLDNITEEKHNLLLKDVIDSVDKFVKANNEINGDNDIVFLCKECGDEVEERIAFPIVKPKSN